MDASDAPLPEPERVEPDSFSLWENLWWGLTNKDFAGMTVYMIVAIALLAAMLLTDSDIVTYVALAFGALGLGLGVFYGLKAFRKFSEMTDGEPGNMTRALEEMDDEMGHRG